VGELLELYIVSYSRELSRGGDQPEKKRWKI